MPTFKSLKETVKNMSSEELKAKQAFFEENYGLAQNYITKHYTFCSDEETQMACIEALWIAVLNYVPSENTAFSSYAFAVIDNFLKSQHRHDSVAKRVPGVPVVPFSTPINDVDELYVEDTIADEAKPYIMEETDIHKILTPKEYEVYLLMIRYRSPRDAAKHCDMSHQRIYDIYKKVRQKLCDNIITL